MRRTLLIKGMHGLGDNLHQRAIVRQLMTDHRVWLESSWVAVYHDLVGPELHVIHKATSLRTQTKNATREASQFSRMRPPPGSKTISVSYKPADVISTRSVLGAMCRATGCDLASADFRLPIPPEWNAAADRLIEQWRPSRPIMLHRPLVARTEWTGCGNRNPDLAAYSELMGAIRDRFFVVSVADLEDKREWLVSEACSPDVALHRGELVFEVLAALAARAALVFCSPGFAVPLAQAVGTPVVCVFGGYENASSFSAGARVSPYLGIEPIHPCQCWSHTHRCDKRIDLPRARARLEEFVNAIAANRAITA
jgi:hypothetical protein